MLVAGLKQGRIRLQSPDLTHQDSAWKVPIWSRNVGRGKPTPPLHSWSWRFLESYYKRVSFYPPIKEICLQSDFRHQGKHKTGGVFIVRNPGILWGWLFRASPPIPRYGGASEPLLMRCLTRRHPIRTCWVTPHGYHIGGCHCTQILFGAQEYWDLQTPLRQIFLKKPRLLIPEEVWGNVKRRLKCEGWKCVFHSMHTDLEIKAIKYNGLTSK